MTYSKDIYKKAYSIVDKRRADANAAADRRKQEILREIPELEEIDRKLASVSVAAAKAVVSGSSDVKTELERLSNISKELQNRHAQLLGLKGYRADVLEPEYTCPICNDTTYVENNGKSVYCQCFLNLLRDCACDEINKLSPLKLSTFDTFSLDYYPYDSNQDGVSPYSRMSKILNFCRNYAANFGVNSPSILMRGATGLGKTHLSLAIANEVLSKGYYVVYVSAPTILSKLERARFDFGAGEEESLMNTLCECDLLIIDDLGTEFSTQYTKSAIYNIFSNRLLKNKPMLINTNMTIRELEAAYSQRFASRIIGSCVKLDFIGKDIRAAKFN